MVWETGNREMDSKCNPLVEAVGYHCYETHGRAHGSGMEFLASVLQETREVRRWSAY